MPVKMSDYGKQWKEVAKAVKDKAGWKCEFCGIPHGTELIGNKGKPYKVCLTTAHLGATKHNKTDYSNLKVLCNRCHLREDHQDHIENAKRSRRRKKLEKQPLLEGFECLTYLNNK